MHRDGRPPEHLSCNMGHSTSQLFKEAFDRCLLMDDRQIITFHGKNQLENFAAEIVRRAPSDPSLLKYIMDRLVGKAAVTADVSLATPQDLDKAIDTSLKDYAKNALNGTPQPERPRIKIRPRDSRMPPPVPPRTGPPIRIPKPENK